MFNFEKCPKCGNPGVNNNLYQNKKVLVCIYCMTEFLPCSDCGGDGIGDYPYVCHTCDGSGIGAQKLSDSAEPKKDLSMSYIENPKTQGSGIVCCIPQPGVCPVGCADCFFQSGRSYLEPLDVNLPNMPDPEKIKGCVVRVNDGNDSNNQPELVMAAVQQYPWRFYNTSIPKHLEKFDAPVVLTINPSEKTDESVVLLNPLPPNLMFVRVRVNTWNLHLVDQAVEYYSRYHIPIVLTFMRYYEQQLPEGFDSDYVYRVHKLNPYWVITPEAWDRVMARYKDNKWVYACGKDADTFACHRCGNCLREYFHTMRFLAMKQPKVPSEK